MARIISLFALAVIVAACGAGLEGSPLLSSLMEQPEPVTMPIPVEVVSLAEAQSQITFNIPTFQALPEELMVGGARVFTPNYVQFFYT